MRGFMPNAGPLGIRRGGLRPLRCCGQSAFKHEVAATLPNASIRSRPKKKPRANAKWQRLRHSPTSWRSDRRRNRSKRAEIEKARKRTKARAPRIAMHVEDRGTAGIVVYPGHFDDEGHMYRLADAFGTRSRQFVYSMLNGLGKATEDHSLDCDFSPGSPNQLKFNAALALIDGVRPQDEIEAMLAAHMAVTNIVLLELVARTRGSIAGHRYEGDGIKRLDVLGNLTNKFMRTYTMQVEALTRKRRKGEQNIRLKHVHVHAGEQAIVGNVSHRGGRGTAKNEQRAYERAQEKPTTRAISDSPSVRSADEERETLPFTSDEQGTLPIAWRRKR
jgi:hypothetical protein